jgi:protocatechuate 3,4-dioxygenase alpha subunit
VSSYVTPSQTVGPYFAMRLPWPDGPYVVSPDEPGAITIFGRMYDGAGNVIPDGLVETWQADPDGRFAHPDDPRGPVPNGYHEFRAFGRCETLSRARCQPRMGGLRRRTWTCRCSPAACWTAA